MSTKQNKVSQQSSPNLKQAGEGKKNNPVIKATLTGLIKDLDLMDLDRKSARTAFLKDADFANDRKSLLARLKLFKGMLSESKNTSEALSHCTEKAKECSKVLAKNLRVAIEKGKHLERSYKALALMIDNTGKKRVRNMTVMNASVEQLTNPDIHFHFKHILDEIESNYDQLDLRNSYSLLVIPGWLGDKKIIDKYAQIAYDNRVMFMTDYRNMPSGKQVIEKFGGSDLSGGEALRTRMMMVCNWLVGRARYDELGEEEDLSIPPSVVLAGKLAANSMAQVSAGKKYGTFRGVDTVSYPLRKAQIAEMESLGLIPITQAFSSAMAFSGRTAYNGSDVGLQTYSVVRTFDYVGKVLAYFLNRRTYENYDESLENDINREITQFLRKIKGPGRLLQDFEIIKIEQDPESKDIIIDINLVPYFPAKRFLITLTGTSGKNFKADTSQN